MIICPAIFCYRVLTFHIIFFRFIFHYLKIIIMKKMLLTAILGLCCFFVKAQSLTVSNGSACTINYYLAATSPTCTGIVGSVTYSIAPFSSVTFSSFAAVSWSSGTPGVGWQWDYIKEWNSCGPMSWTPPACGQDVCAVGIACSGLPISSCMNITTTCNTCSAVKTQWFPTGGGNVAIRIW